MNIFIAEIDNHNAVFTSEESWHCFKVLRYKVGDEVSIIDGKGASYKGKLVVASEKQCVAQVTEGPFYQEKRNYYLHLAIAPTKQIDRIEWMIEKAVEIGIDEFTFLKCKNSERVNLKIDRVKKIVESAVKQSKQALIPKVNDLTEFKNAMNIAANTKYIAFCDDAEKVELKAAVKANLSALVMIGPEGDFATEEIELANTNGFKALSLGRTRLRTETAGLYVVQAFSLLT